MIQIRYVIKLRENGFYKGGVFYKKTNKFEYDFAFNDMIKYYAMTKENAYAECDYLKNTGWDCFVDEIVVQDSQGSCAFRLNDVKDEISEWLSANPDTAYLPEAFVNIMWDCSLIDLSEETYKFILEEVCSDPKYNVCREQITGGYIFQEKS